MVKTAGKSLILLAGLIAIGTGLGRLGDSGEVCDSARADTPDPSHEGIESFVGHARGDGGRLQETIAEGRLLESALTSSRAETRPVARRRGGASDELLLAAPGAVRARGRGSRRAVGGGRPGPRPLDPNEVAKLGYGGPDHYGEYLGPVFPPPPPECTITITKILGARKDVIGNYSQLVDPDKPGRLFTDTSFSGGINDVPNQQEVVLEARLTGANWLFTDVLWRVYDPDDPASHAELDENGANGGDNYDAFASEFDSGAQHFLSAHQHGISDRDSPGSDPLVPGKVIGEARTTLDQGLRSTVKFHYADEGGDNYRIEAICVPKFGALIERAKDSTATLTVWRKRQLWVHAMASDKQDGTFDPLPQGAVAFKAGFANPASPDRNCYVDFELETIPPGVRVSTLAQDENSAGKFPLQTSDSIAVSVDGASTDVFFDNVMNSGAATATEVLTAFDSVPSAIKLDQCRRIRLQGAQTIRLDDLSGSPLYGLFGHKVVTVSAGSTGLLSGSRLIAHRILDPQDFPLLNTLFHKDDTGNHEDYRLQLIGCADSNTWDASTTSEVDLPLGLSVGPHAYVNVEKIDAGLLSLSSYDYPGDLLPIESGDKLTVSRTPQESQTVTFQGPEFDGSVPVQTVVDAINVALASGTTQLGAAVGELSDPSNPGQTILDGRLVLLALNHLITSITVTTDGIPDRLGFPDTPADRTSGKVATAIHEVGHGLTPHDGDEYHDDHTSGSPCAAEDGSNHALFFCPRHVLRFRDTCAWQWTLSHGSIYDSFTDFPPPTGP